MGGRWRAESQKGRRSLRGGMDTFVFCITVKQSHVRMSKLTILCIQICTCYFIQTMPLYLIKLLMKIVSNNMYFIKLSSTTKFLKIAVAILGQINLR